MNYAWSEAKDKQLREARGIGFLDVIKAIGEGGLLGNMEHPNPAKFAHQRILIENIDGYVYRVPYVLDEEGRLFLKTAYPSRKETRRYLAGDQ